MEWGGLAVVGDRLTESGKSEVCVFCVFCEERKKYKTCYVKFVCFIRPFILLRQTPEILYCGKLIFLFIFLHHGEFKLFWKCNQLE